MKTKTVDTLYIAGKGKGNKRIGNNHKIKIWLEKMQVRNNYYSFGRDPMFFWYMAVRCIIATLCHI